MDRVNVGMVHIGLQQVRRSERDIRLHPGPRSDDIAWCHAVVMTKQM